MKRILLLAALAAALIAPAARASSSVPVIYVENDSTIYTNDQIAPQIPAFQTAVTADLAPIWGTPAVLTTDPAQAKSADYTIYLLDDSDQFGALGYHDVGNGKPYAKVFLADSATFDVAWQIVFTHELFEMLVDPYINHFRQFNKRMWLAEVGDPVEDGYYSFSISGIPISDFITPAWYRAGKGPFDFTRGLKRPGQIGRHGYASYFTDGGWSQVFGYHAEPKNRM